MTQRSKPKLLFEMLLPHAQFLKIGARAARRTVTNLIDYSFSVRPVAPLAGIAESDCRLQSHTVLALEATCM